MRNIINIILLGICLLTGTARSSNSTPDSLVIQNKPVYHAIARKELKVKLIHTSEGYRVIPADVRQPLKQRSGQPE